MRVRVVRRRKVQIGAGERAFVLPNLLHRINHRRIALQRDILPESIFKSAGHERALFRLGSFTFDQRGERDDRGQGAAMFPAVGLPLAPPPPPPRPSLFVFPPPPPDSSTFS